MPKGPDKTDHASKSERLRRESDALIEAARRLRAEEAELSRRMKELAAQIADHVNQRLK